MAERETILRRKLAAQGKGEAVAADSGARQWKTAFARAARDEIGLDLTVASLRDDRLSLTELLDFIPTQALMAMLEGPESGLGLLVMSPSLTAAVIEAQTMGRLGPLPAPPRRPTRTDAAMCASVIDRALTLLETALATAPDLTWTAGFRYASFLEEARALALLLDDIPYRALISELEIAGGARQGQLILILPAEGRGPVPAEPPQHGRSLRDHQSWQLALTEAVLTSEIVLEAQMGRIRMPLSQAKALTIGAVLRLDGARTDSVTLNVAGGGSLPSARLGQHRGQRAVKLAIADLMALADPLPPSLRPQDAPALLAPRDPRAPGGD